MVAFCAVLLVISQANYYLVEKPCRYVLKKYSIRECLSKLWHGQNLSLPRSSLGKRPIAHMVLTQFLLLLLTFATVGAAYLHGTSHFDGIDKTFSLGAVFGDKFTLQRVLIGHTKDGIQLKCFWKSCRKQRLTEAVAVHVIDHSLQTIGYYDYFQSTRHREVRTNEEWVDKVYIPNTKLSQATKIGLAVYSKDPSFVDRVQLFGIDGNPNNNWVILPLKLDCFAPKGMQYR